MVSNLIPAPVQQILGHLDLTGSNKDFILLYTHKGVPIWAANQGGHPWQESLNLLLEENIRHFFILPQTASLNELCGNPESGDKLYASKNRFENRSFSILPTTSLPLSIIRLTRVDNDFFLGLVSFTAIARHWIHAGRLPTLTADASDRIIAYGDVLAARGGGEKASWLGMRVTELFDFNRPAVDAPGAAGPEKEAEHFEWRPPDSRHLPFIPAKPGVPALKIDSNGLLFDNSGHHEYAFWKWRGSLKTGLCHFELEVTYDPVICRLPCLILGGLPADKHQWPDNQGLAFAPVAQGRALLKQANNPVRCFNPPSMSAESSAVLRIIKVFDHYTFMMNQTVLGSFVDDARPDPRQPDLLHLFLRPGEQLRLSAFRLKVLSIGAAERARELPELTARPKAFSEESCFAVTLRQGYASGQNYTHYFLDDITGLDRKVRTLVHEKERLSIRLGEEGEMVGRTPAIAKIREAVAGVAASDLTVLIEGETGVGKEVLARAIHRRSRFQEGPCIKVDCSAIPQTLIESELFGHEKGAFTGALTSQPGRFEQAHGGTLILDEIANLTPQVQAKLLGVLQDKTIQRIGGLRALPLDIRVIALSNEPLLELIEKGRFRADLYYRLNQYRLLLPPLRERRDDIPLLTRFFIEEANRIHKKHVREADTSALKKLYSAPWPGNVRELRNVVHRSVVFAPKSILRAEDILAEEPGLVQAKNGQDEKVLRPWRKCRMERKELSALLKTTEGNVAAAAREIGVSRVTLYKVLKKFNVPANEYRPG